MKKTISYIKKEQKKISSMVTSKYKNYYLTGGTALSFYFNHRLSEDLDFFTQKYKRDTPDKIMDFVSKKTRFPFKLEAEQKDPKLVPMKVYFMELKQGVVLKVDFVQDFMENVKRIKNGLHSIEDIYLRKIAATTGIGEKMSITGKILPAGRQTARDLYDIFYLSQKHKPISNFFLEYYSRDKAENLIAWYRSFNRMSLKMELLDLVPGIDTGKVFKHLDDEIIKKLPDKLISRGI